MLRFEATRAADERQDSQPSLKAKSQITVIDLDPVGRESSVFVASKSLRLMMYDYSVQIKRLNERTALLHYSNSRTRPQPEFLVRLAGRISTFVDQDHSWRVCCWVEVSRLGQLKSNQETEQEARNRRSASMCYNK